MATATFLEILDYMVDNYHLGRRGTNTGTATTSITDDPNFGGHGAAENVEVGCEVLITFDQGDTNAKPEGQIRRLSSRPKLTTGVMNVDPDFADALASGDLFTILFRPFRFQGGQYGVRDKINQAITERPWQRRLVPITLVTDGDMLAATAGSWTAVDGAGGSDNPTLAKAELSFPLALRVLRVTNNATGAGDYARSATIPVEENQTYYLEGTGQIGSSGAAADAGTLVLYDVTNAGPITLINKDIDRFEPETLVNTVTMPSGCEQVQIRLTCTAVSDIIEWSNIIFRKASVREHTVADRGLPAGRLGSLFAGTNKNWAERGDTMPEVAGEPRQLGGGMWQYHTEQSMGGYSLWYEEFFQPSTFTTIASAGGQMDETTTIDKEALAAVAAEILFKPLAGEDRWRKFYLTAAYEAAKVRGEYMDELRTIVQPQRVHHLSRV
jgi:hypothetical protein